MADLSDPLTDFHRRLGAASLAPLWEVMRELAPREPRSKARPMLWRHADYSKLVLEAGALISAEQAERRVLVLENPALPGQSRITPSLYAGVQLILPGETAPSHRHTANALRLVLSGQGAHTSVDGERVPMQPGDFIITPSGTFHDHGNDGDEPVMWLDGLDVPIVNMFEAGFSQEHPQSRQPLSRPEGDAQARYAQGLLPVDYDASRPRSPLFSYPFERTRAALESMRRHQQWDAADGLRLRYTDPATGASPLRSMGAYVQLLPKGFRGEPLRATDGTVFAVVEGAGAVDVDGQRFDFCANDLFVVPSWTWRRFEAAEDTVLFSFSDRPLQEWLGIWRDSRPAG